MKKIEKFEEKYLKKDLPEFNIGDTVLVHLSIKEEGKVRIQVFEGVVLKRKGRGVRSTFTVRRISYGEGLERTFLLHSPFIDRITIKKKGSVRRAKLYYLRKRKGKKSKVEEKIESRSPASAQDALPRKEGA